MAHSGRKPFCERLALHIVMSMLGSDERYDEILMYQQVPTFIWKLHMLNQIKGDACYYEHESIDGYALYLCRYLFSGYRVIDCYDGHA